MIAHLEEDEVDSKKGGADRSICLKGNGCGKGFLYKNNKTPLYNCTEVFGGDSVVIHSQTPRTGVRNTEVGAVGTNP